MEKYEMIYTNDKNRHLSIKSDPYKIAAYLRRIGVKVKLFIYDDTKEFALAVPNTKKDIQTVKSALRLYGA